MTVAPCVRSIAKSFRGQYTPLFCVLLVCCSRPEAPHEATYADVIADPSRPAISPSGEFLLEIEQFYKSGFPYAGFRVREVLTDETVFVSSDNYLLTHTTYFLWDDASRIWVYSGDRGLFYWELTETESETVTWRKSTYLPNRGHPSPPEFLRLVRPRLLN
jgi:hypothetical protein